jgi:protease I
VRAWKFTDWGDRFPVDVPLAQADPNAYDALLLPGGVMNPDVLRRNQDALRLVQAFFAVRNPSPLFAMARGR